MLLDATGMRVRFADTDTQLKAKDVIDRGLNPDPKNPTYVVALNLLSASPNWLTAIHALPMYLGLDLRGGVHFLLQVDMQAAIIKRLESLRGRRALAAARQEHPPRRHHARGPDAARALPRRGDARQGARRAARRVPRPRHHRARRRPGPAAGGHAQARGGTPQQDYAIKQNITTLHNRVNQLGVAEPVIQQQGADRIVVQLPGVQDTAKAKEILGRTATLEVRLVDEEHMTPEALIAASRGQVPFGTETSRARRPAAAGARARWW